MAITPRVLLIDDEEVVIRSLGRMLRRAYQCEVRGAHSNAEAVIQLENWRPDLIITDLRRPEGTGGAEFVRDLRENAATANIPVLVLSGSVEMMKESLGAGLDVDGYLQKPTGTVDILRRAARLLRVHDDPDAALITLGYESADLDYKQTIDLSEKNRAGRAALAKDVLAFTNTGGGTIVVGVADNKAGSFEPVGLTETQLEELETTRVNNAIRKFVGTTVPVLARRVELHERQFVVIRIPPSIGTLALAQQECIEAGLRRGCIYARTDAAESAQVEDGALLARLYEAARGRGHAS